MKKNIVIVVLAIIAVVSVSIIIAGANFLKGIDYQAIEMHNGKTIIAIRPCIISNNGMTVSYIPVDESLRVYSSNIGAPMENISIWWMD